MNTNKLQWGAIVLLSLAVAYPAFFSKNKQKAAYIDTPLLISKYQGAIDARAELEEKLKVWKGNVDTLGMELQGSIQKFEAERPKLSAKEIKLSEELLSNKRDQFMQYQQAMQQKAQEEEQKINQKVLQEVNLYIKEYGSSKDYAYIHGATNIGNLVYADEAYNVTEDVIAGLNAKYKK